MRHIGCVILNELTANSKEREMIFLKPLKTNLSYLNSILGTLIVFWTSVFLLNLVTETPAQTLLATFISGFFAITLLVFKLRREMGISLKFCYFVLTVFSLRVIIGVLHYVVVMDSSYFISNAPEFNYLWDYEWLLYWMTRLSEEWVELGFGYLPTSWFLEKNTGLMPYFSLLFYLGDNKHFLNLAVLNSFHNLLVAILVSRLAFYNLGHSYTKSVFIIALLHPFGIFSSILWRDSVGQFFLFSGALMIFQYRGSLAGALKPLVGIAMIMMLRNIYIFVGLLLFGIQIWFFSKGKYFLRILIIGLIGILSIYLSGFVMLVIESIKGLDPGSLTLGKSIGGFIAGLAKGLIGPFPWTQMLDANITGREFLLSDIFQAIFTQTILLMFVVACLKRKVLFTYVNTCIMIFTFSIMFMGLLSYGHVAYVSVPSLLLLAVIPHLSLKRFLQIYVSLFSSYFVIGIIWMLMV